MPGDPFSKVRPGEDVAFSATAWNAFLDAAKAEQQRRLSRDSSGPPQVRDAAIVRVKNETGADLRRNSVVGLAGPVFGPADSLDAFLREVTFRGRVPAGGDEGRFAVLLAPARAGAVAKAYVAGVCQVRVDVTDPTLSCAEAQPGSTAALVTSESGSAQVLWREAETEGYAGDGTGAQWAVVRLGATCGGSSKGAGAGGRCDCKDPPYEIEVDCGDCGAYYGGGTEMPRIWVLTIGNARTIDYYDYCESTRCEALVGVKATLTNEADPYGYGGYDGGYGGASCVWSGPGGKCIHAELALGTDVYGDEIWKLTILDRDDCLLALLTMPVDAFHCCAANTGWTVDPASVCDLTVTLAPHPCTCCHGKTCPPEGQVVCSGTDCCLGDCTCTITVLVHNLATPSPIPCTQFDLDCCTIDGDPCPAPVGDPGRLSCYQCGSVPTPERSCGGMNGSYAFTWAGDCVWRFRGVPGGGTGTTKVAAELRLEGRKWRLELLGEGGQTATFESDGLHCTRDVAMTFKGGSCPVLGPAPTAGFLLCEDLP